MAAGNLKGVTGYPFQIPGMRWPILDCKKYCQNRWVMYARSASVLLRLLAVPVHDQPGEPSQTRRRLGGNTLVTNAFGMPSFFFTIWDLCFSKRCGAWLGDKQLGANPD